MRILLAAIVASAISAQAQDIQWLGIDHNFGAFSEDSEKISTEFKFVNHSDADVSIISVAATCGCTVPKYDDSPIAPGDTATIEVTYNPVGRPGRFDKQIYVRTSASPERYRLVIRGTVIGNAASIKARYPVSMGPLKLRASAAMMGRVKEGHAKMEYIDAYNQSTDTIQPQFLNVPDYLTVEAIPAFVPPGELVSINLFFHGEKAPELGILADSLTIVPFVGSESYQLPITAIVEEDFSNLTAKQMKDAPVLWIEGDRINLGTILPNSASTVRGETIIYNRGKDPLKVHRVYSTDSALQGFVTKETLKGGEHAKLVIEYDPSFQPTGIINSRVTVVTNDPANPMVTLRVIAERD